jgi:glycosyltransferase involved in cell wall biosynthesis
VSTSFGVQGHTQVDGDYPGVVLGDTADDWVAALTRLVSDASRDEWQRLSREGAAYVASDYSPATHRLAVQAIFSRWDGRE